MRKIGTFFVVFLFCFQSVWAGEGNSQTYHNGFDGDLVFDHETDEGMDSISNTLIANGGAFTGNIITGQSEKGSALSNELRLVGGTFDGDELYAGVSVTKNAENNVINAKNVSLTSQIVAGSALAGTASGNAVNLTNTTAEYSWVIGGETVSGVAKGNTIQMQDTSLTSANAAAGVSYDTGNVSYNTVNVLGGSRLGRIDTDNSVYGGYGQSGAVFNNQVNLTDTADVLSDIYGGYSAQGAAERNLVKAGKTNVSGNIYGGYAAGPANASGNEVQLGASSHASSVVAGGWNGGSGHAVSNKVSVASGAELSNTAAIYGGYALQGDASENQVKLQSASVGSSAYGGYAAAGNASANELSITGATQGGTALAAGYAQAGAAEGNVLSVSRSSLSVSNALYGAYGGAGASGNRVSVSASSVTGNVYGGYAQTGNASGNVVELNASTITGDVYGGYSASGGDTDNNTLILSGTAKVNGNFYGGNNASSQGNTLQLNNYGGTINQINNFQRVALRGLAKTVTFTTDVTAEVEIYGRPSEFAQTVAYTPNGSSLTLTRDGVLGAYEYELEGVAEGARTAWKASGTYQNDLAKPYAQAQLAGLALAVQGDDFLDGVFNEAMTENSPNKMFGNVYYGGNKYKTGSHFDLHSLLVQGGRWWRPADTAYGAFVQYMHGKYDTNPVEATGHFDGFALGGFALRPYSEQGRFEAVLRAGYQHGKFNSEEILSELSNDGWYGALSAGIVQNAEALQLYGKVGGVYLLGDDVRDDLGQSIKFKDVFSLRGKAGARVFLGTWGQNYKPYVGAAGLYEIGGKSQVRVDGHKVNDAKISGLTGRAEVGVTHDRSDDLFPQQSSLVVFWQTGRICGWGGEIRLGFAF